MHFTEYSFYTSFNLYSHLLSHLLPPTNFYLFFKLSTCMFFGNLDDSESWWLWWICITISDLSFINIYSHIWGLFFLCLLFPEVNKFSCSANLLVFPYFLLFSSILFSLLLSLFMPYMSCTWTMKYLLNW